MSETSPFAAIPCKVRRLFSGDATMLVAMLLPATLLASRTLAELSVVCVAALFLFRAWRLHDWNWAHTAWFKACLLFWGYLVLVNTPLSLQPAESLGYALSFIRWPLFAAALAYWILSADSRKTAFLLTLALGILCLTIDLGWQFFTGIDLFGHPKLADRLTGPYTDPMPGILLVRVWFILLFAALIFPTLAPVARNVAFNALLLAAGTVMIFITGERMALILFLSGTTLVMAGLWGRHSRHSFVVSAGVTTVAAIIAFSAVFLPATTTHRALYSTVEKIQNLPRSDYGQVFATAYQAWTIYPVWGSGLHTYREVCQTIAETRRASLNCSHPHNLYLHILAETGLAGLMLFVFAILAIYRAALLQPLRQKQWQLLALACTVLSVSFWPLIGGISLLNNWMAAVAWLGVGWSIAMSPAGVQENSIGIV